MSPSPEPPYQLQSLCSRCEHVRVIRSERGSTFLRCGAARTEPRLPKYPPQPVRVCFAFVEGTPGKEEER